MTIEEWKQLKKGDIINSSAYGDCLIVKEPMEYDYRLDVIGFDYFNQDYGLVATLLDQPRGYGWNWIGGQNCYGFDTRNAQYFTLVSRASKHPLIKAEFLEGIEL